MGHRARRNSDELIEDALALLAEASDAGAAVNPESSG